MQADVQPTATRPDPPTGHLYLADVLDIVRRHAKTNRWCSEAEGFVRDTFRLSEEDMPYQAGQRHYCCVSCDGNREEFMKRHAPIPRFTLTDPARTVRVSALKDAVRTGINVYADGDDDAEYRDMFGDIIDTFRLPIDKP